MGDLLAGGIGVRMKLKGWLFAACLISLTLQGCGYTTRSAMPENVKSIYVKTVVNKINVAEIIAYKPGLEIDITNAIVKRLQRDGNLKVAKTPEEADVILESDLIRFDQEGLRFSRLETSQELKIYLVLSMRLRDEKSQQIIWEEQNFSGDQEYFISQLRDQAQNDAADLAVERLARNVVDRIVEDW